MGQSFFQFKQFTVHQSHAALKVCTESCLFGTVVPVEKATTILDIGTGTGLLALMMAQRSSATIEAIELDEGSCQDAQINFESSPWKERLLLHQGDAKTWQPTHRFDLIVCNPPFFIDHLKSSDQRTNAALHGSELQPSDLADLVTKWTTTDGHFFVLLPEKEMELLTPRLLRLGWFKKYEYTIYQEASKNVFRKIGGFSKQESKASVISRDLIIYNADRSYTRDFVDLLKSYYLYL